MKKLFALLLALTMLFLTACNNSFADSTTGTETGTGTGTDNSQNTGTVNELELQNTIVYNLNMGFIDLPSRIIYDAGKVYYYSKADGKAYVYCFDPLCEHNDGDCLATAGISIETMGFNFENTFFINNRFYCPTSYGKIISFSFDGTDIKIEYDAEYETAEGVWGHSMSAGHYIYTDLRSYASEDGKAHTLRFNVETGEMEDLTEKTGHYIWPTFLYNGMIYGYDEGIGFLKADIDLKSCEEIEKIPYTSCCSGSCFYSIVCDQDGVIKVRVYDMETESAEYFEIPDLKNWAATLYVDENYIYFYQDEVIYLGDYWYKNELKPYKKTNNGSIYRINHDGTGLVCIYEEEDFEITGRVAVIAGDKILVEGRNIIVRDNNPEMWDNGLLVGTIGADGKIDELKPVEVVE